MTPPKDIWQEVGTKLWRMKGDDKRIEREGNNVQKAVTQQIHIYRDRKEEMQKGLLSWL
jgi:hypothetical protein